MELKDIIRQKEIPPLQDGFDIEYPSTLTIWLSKEDGIGGGYNHPDTFVEKETEDDIYEV